MCAHDSRLHGSLTSAGAAWSVVPVITRTFPAGNGPAFVTPGEPSMSIGTILVVVLLIVLIGALPNWQYSSGWGYYPSGILGIILVVLVVLILMGRL